MNIIYIVLGIYLIYVGYGMMKSNTKKLKELKRKLKDLELKEKGFK